MIYNREQNRFYVNFDTDVDIKTVQKRDFRIKFNDRRIYIRKLEVLLKHFTPDPTFNTKEYIGSIFQHEVGDKILSVEVWFDAKTAPYIRERRWHYTQEIAEHEDGSLTLKMSVRGINDLKRWVMWYGRGAVVKSPPELVELVREEIKMMNQHYFCGGGE